MPTTGRPLEATVNAFRDAGFGVDGIIETRPDPQAVNRWPDELGSLTDIPTFIIYRLDSCNGQVVCARPRGPVIDTLPGTVLARSRQAHMPATS